MATVIFEEEFLDSPSSILSRFDTDYPNRWNRSVITTNTFGVQNSYDFGAADSSLKPWFYQGSNQAGPWGMAVLGVGKYPTGQHSNVDWDGPGGVFEPLKWRGGVLSTFNNATGQHRHLIQAPFKVKVRAAIPYIKHGFPAIWLTDNTNSFAAQGHTFGERLELDLVEVFGQELGQKAVHNIHYTWADAGWWQHTSLGSILTNANAKNMRYMLGLNYPGVQQNLNTSWAEYEVRVNYLPGTTQAQIDAKRADGTGLPGKVEFLINGVVTSTAYIPNLVPYKETLVLNNNLRTSVVGDSTANPYSEMLVDYIKVYDLKDEYAL